MGWWVRVAYFWNRRSVTVCLALVFRSSFTGFSLRNVTDASVPPLPSSGTSSLLATAGARTSPGTLQGRAELGSCIPATHLFVKLRQRWISAIARIGMRLALMIVPAQGCSDKSHPAERTLPLGSFAQGRITVTCSHRFINPVNGYIKTFPSSVSFR